MTLEDPHTEDLSQEVRGFIFSRILVCSFSHPLGQVIYFFKKKIMNEKQEKLNSCILLVLMFKLFTFRDLSYLQKEIYKKLEFHKLNFH